MRAFNYRHGWFDQAITNGGSLDRSAGERSQPMLENIVSTT